MIHDLKNLALGRSHPQKPYRYSLTLLYMVGPLAVSQAQTALAQTESAPASQGASFSSMIVYASLIGAIVLLVVLMLRARRRAGQLEQTIGQLEQNIQTVVPALQESPVFLFGFDAESRITFWNARLSEVTGHDLAQMQASPELGNQFLPLTPDPALSIKSNEQRNSREIHFRGMDGREHTLNITYSQNTLPVPGVVTWGVVNDVTRRAMAMELLKAERAVLHAVTARRPLQDVLLLVIEMIERQIPDSRVSVLLLDKAAMMIEDAIGPHLPEEYNQAIIGLEVGDNRGSCGTAAWRGESVIVEDIETDPLWAAYKHLALQHGLRACWSSPFKGRENRVLGTFAIYILQPAAPTPHQMTMIQAATDMTALIVGHFQGEEERRHLAAQMQQAQKLESLGVLAGGVAHDFNNLLMSILGNADLALMDLSPTSPVAFNLHEIQRASQRAADLAHQMLAYSGQGRFMIEKIDLNAAIVGLERLIRSSIDKQVELELQLAPALPPIESDASQLRQMVQNLVLNASEAIEQRTGRITIRTQVRHWTREQLAQTVLDDRLPPGLYVALEVEDTGCGMDEGTRQRIFDPFFTLKFAGRGLGLPAVLGIVRGNRGAIQIASKPGNGTTVTVLFPSAEATTRKMQTPINSNMEWSGEGLVLVVDDEEAVRKVSRHMLERMGFRVVSARDGSEAIDVYRQHQDAIVCVLLDLTMPVTGGEACLRELRKISPDVPVVLSSGYDQPSGSSIDGNNPRTGFIQKPYQMSALRESLRGMLQAGADK